MEEKYYDDLFDIQTGDYQMGFYRSLHYHHYEPTPYHALEQLFEKYKLKSSDHIVDFGCGKGRLNFFIHYFFHASVVGIEMNETFYQEALDNRMRYMKKTKRNSDNIQFQCCLAEKYEIDPLDNRFYFFNPFSVQIFMKVVNNILFSVENSPRDIELVLYYSSDDYVFFLENQTAFELKDEVVLEDLSEKNSYERFLIYRLSF